MGEGSGRLGGGGRMGRGLGLSLAAATADLSYSHWVLVMGRMRCIACNIWVIAYLGCRTKHPK